MDRPRCPGQDMRNWKPGDIFVVACPSCSAEIEFFKDEPALICRACGVEVRNPRIDLGCAKWCKFAEQCLGTAGEQVVQAAILDRLAVAVERAMGLSADARARAEQAMSYARQIISADGGDPLVVQAAILFNEAERHSRTSNCRPGQPADPCQTRIVLAGAGLDGEMINRVCQVLWSMHTGLEDDSPEFAAAWDATQLARLAAGGPAACLEDALRTRTAVGIARELEAGNSQT